MKKYIFIIAVFTLLFSCQKNSQQSFTEAEESITLLNSVWQTQDQNKIQLKDLKGNNIVMVLIFTNCKTTCPLLVNEMQKIAQKIEPKKLKQTKLVFVSIDPENDTAEVLKSFAKQNNMDGDPYLFLRSDKESVRELANVLSVKFKKISPMIFSHSNIITAFDENGAMIAQTEGLGNEAEIVEAVNTLD